MVRPASRVKVLMTGPLAPFADAGAGADDVVSRDHGDDARSLARGLRLLRRDVDPGVEQVGERELPDVGHVGHVRTANPRRNACLLQEARTEASALGQLRMQELERYLLAERGLAANRSGKSGMYFRVLNCASTCPFVRGR